MRKYKELPANTVLQGDIRGVAKDLPDRSVNMIVTSPPYYGLRDYELPPTHWPEVSYSPMAGLPPLVIPPVECCLGLEESIEAYVGHMVLVFRGLWRVLRDDGTVWLNLGDSYANSSKGSIVIENSTLGGSKTYQANGTPPSLLDKTKLGLNSKNLLGIPWRVAFALQADGWYLRSDIIWHKKNPMPESVTDRPTKGHEYLFLLAKSARYYYDQDAIRETASYDGRKDTLMKGSTKLVSVPGQTVQSSALNGTERWPNKTKDGLPGRNKRSVWSISTKPYKKAHFATFPPDLIEPCVLAGCPPGGVVLDPFFGSGTVGEVCVRTGRRWLGVELNADYIALANERISRTQPALFPPGGIG